MSSMIGMSLLASSAAFRNQIEGLTNGSKSGSDEDPTKPGKQQQQHQEDDHGVDQGDYHQVDNNGNLENGEHFRSDRRDVTAQFLGQVKWLVPKNSVPELAKPDLRWLVCSKCKKMFQ
jgi:hypothetical protein